MKEITKVPAKLKYKTADFIVEEIGEKWPCAVSEKFTPNTKPNLKNLDFENIKDFLWCELERQDIEQFRTMKELANDLGVEIRDIGYAGTKDKIAWTSQRISIFQPDIEKIKDFQHPNIVLKNFKWAKRKIKLGYLDANHFKIILRDIDKKDAIKVQNQILKIKQFPNYFGAQRFGTKKDNYNIGKAILKKDFKEAVDILLPDMTRNDRISKRYKAGDYLGVLKGFEKKKLLFFINTVQSKIFNEILEIALEERIDFTKEGQKNTILIGHKTRFSQGRLGEIEQQVLSEHGLTPEDFNLRDISYLRMKGAFRKALTEVKDLEVEIQDDEEFQGSKKIILGFTLPSGVYATTFFDNFFEFH